MRQLSEPAFTAVPTAVDIQALFQSALHISGTLPFPVPDAFYESQRLQNRDMEFYWAPVSKPGTLRFSSATHNVLCKQFPAGTEMMQAGLFLTLAIVCLLLHSMGCDVQGHMQLVHFAVGNVDWCNVSALFYHIFR